MATFKEKIENLFEILGHRIYQNRFKTLLIVLIISAALAFQLKYIAFDTSFEGMLHEDDPGRIMYNSFRDQFGRDELVLLAIDAPNIFDAEFLKKLQALHNDLENEVPFVHEVRSLINARSTRGEGDVLVVDKLLEGFPKKKINLDELRDYVLSNPVYLNNYISEDGKITAVAVETLAVIEDTDGGDDILDSFEDDPHQEDTSESWHYFSEQETKQVAEAVHKITARYHSSEFSIFLTGGPIIEAATNHIIQSDIKILTIVTYLVMTFFLGLLFRRISGIVTPLIIVFITLVATGSLMAISKIPVTQATMILPSILSAIGVADSIHILAIFFRRFQQGYSKEDAIAFALGHSGLAVLMTSLTTSAGFLSFAFSELSTIGHLGIFTSVGVIIAFIYSIILLPALLAVFPIKYKKEGEALKKSKIMDRVLIWFTNFSTANPGKIILAGIVIFVVFTAFLFKLNFSLNLIKYYSEDMPIRKASALFDDRLRGGLSIEVIVDTGKENGIHAPDILNSIEKVSDQMVKIDKPDIFVGKVFSIVDILKETNQALHANKSTFYTIPQDRETIAQEFLLFEGSGSDDLERIVDSQFSKTRITVKIPVVIDVVVIDKLLADFRKIFKNEFSGRAKVTITGMGELMSRTLPAALRSMSKSYITAFVVITFMMILLVGDLKIGLISMIPNLLPIIFVMGYMGAAGYPVDINALMIGSIGMGLVVDDTMHFMHNFRKYYKKTGDPVEGVRETLLGAGRAMLITSIVLTASFFVWMMASLSSGFIFGLCTGMVIIFALLADFVLAPALMVSVTCAKEVNG